ncbi:MAG: hypothetical protein IPP80_06930 [Ignavibacteria bacterium]|nr:hypothetical protein [Ignavibacteria bacterium]MBK6417753.1 hypothetical protein [Ignavibacteria bacterium]MBK7411260.1 hypothetical protein [Ignavibacteria bacterium]MBK9184195.1 hypothetical protein [Ignavibacteria bacterium]MBL0322098.1 hypothetical protein [Ignavibacteria bacterium]
MRSITRFGTFAFVLAMAVASIGFSGCEELANATTFTVPITITVRPESNNPSIPKTDQACKDMSTETSFMDNKDKISGGKVKEAFFQIIDLTDPVFASGTINDQIFTSCSFTLTFDASYGDVKVYNLGTFTNVKLSDLIAGKMAVPVSADFEEAIKLIPRRPKFCFNAVYGSFNTGPASAAHIQGKLDVTIDFEASAL